MHAAGQAGDEARTVRGSIIDSAGRVAGVVFAASVTDDDTGYALTADQVSDAAAEGRTSETERSTEGCAG